MLRRAPAVQPRERVCARARAPSGSPVHYRPSSHRVAYRGVVRARRRIRGFSALNFSRGFSRGQRSARVGERTAVGLFWILWARFWFTLGVEKFDEGKIFLHGDTSRKGHFLDSNDRCLDNDDGILT